MLLLAGFDSPSNMILRTCGSVASLSCIGGTAFQRQHGELTRVSASRAPVRQWKRSFIALRSRAQASSNELAQDVPDRGSAQGSVQIDLQLPRRRLLVQFKCNVCETTTQRLVNPEAYKRGTVFVQCAGCEAYHQLVDNLGLIQEYDFRKEGQDSTDDSDSSAI
eukprot:TRINITY_DN5375_c0_g1_i1.p1 TRINITY_DN5375_c0_g1~~TRINITY_DN5375_c0_g1_i1.p1  ORF type:complete len:164 (-),score=15.06 TRINITY_DN5375_c0_g1_i1:402-893(-)